ncbi:hypothetical protein Trydic_g16403 [Trypoxylus dichotomus]
MVNNGTSGILESPALPSRVESSKDLSGEYLGCPEVVVSTRTLFAQPGAEFVRRRPEEAFHPDHIIPTVN